jgi:ATP-dependent helicase/nuclease subunit B
MMGLRLLAGPPGSGKTHWILQEIVAINRADPLGPPILLLVPEQATHQTDRLLLTNGLLGSVRVEVLSFSLLGRWIDSRRPRHKPPVLTDLHRQVIITSVLARMKREEASNAVVSVPHMESAIAAFLAEMKQGNVRTSELRDWATKVRERRPALATKLGHLAEVLEAFDDAVKERFEDPQDTMLSMASSVREIVELRGAQVYVDGFYGFTAVEREMLRGLVGACPRVTMTLVLDRPIKEAETSLKLSGIGSGRCTPSMETLQQLLRLSDDAELIDMDSKDVGGAKQSFRFTSPEIAHVTSGFLMDKTPPNKPIPGKISTIGSVNFVEALDSRDEARWAAEQIEAWHRDKGWHWGEMAIIARTLDMVSQEMEEALTLLHIPHFIDRNQPQETHPVIQGTLAALETVLRGWRQESILAFAKSGLCQFDEHRVARLEWFVLKYPRSPEDWRSSRRWAPPPLRSPFDPEDSRAPHLDNIEDIDDIRQEIIQPLKQLESRLRDARKEGENIATSRIIEAICHLINEAMTPYLDSLRSEGCLDRVAEEESLLRQAGRLLETIAVSAGAESFESAVLLDLLRSALGGFRLQRIPPILDQLVVAQIDRSRLPELKGVVVIGLAEGHFPPSGSNRSLLSDDERDLIAELGPPPGRERELRASSRRMFLREGFLAWMAMTRASEALTLLRPEVSKDGEPLNASPWWVEVQRLIENPVILQTAKKSAAERVARAREVASLACARWAGTQERFPRLPEEIVAAAAENLAKDRNASEFREVISWAYRRNSATLSPSTVEKVLTDRWAASATALESFASCPFKFFMHSIMRPDVRQDVRANPMDLGNLAHAVLKSALEHVASDHLRLAELEDVAIEEIIDRCSTEPLKRLQLAGLLTNPLGEIQASLFLEQVTDVLKHSRDLARHLPLRTLVTEGSFKSHGTELTPPRFGVTLEDGSPWEIPLRGQIDRIDAWGDTPWLFVMDYKSSRKTVNWTLLMKGISLQLPIYMLVLDENRASLGGGESTIGGAFYKPISAAKDTDKRMRGLISDSAVTKLAFADAEKSFVTIGRNANEGDRITDEEMESLKVATRRRLKEHLQHIVRGSCEVRPYRVATEGPCTFCQFRMACRLDFSMNRRNAFPKSPKQKAMDFLVTFAQGEKT